jgi:type II secretory pathway component PulJ
MGSSTFIDIVGSMIIGGLLLLAALRMNDSATRNNFASQENLTVQQNLKTLVQLLERDFRRIGYQRNGNVNPNDGCVLYGDRNCVVFRGDVDDNGYLDTVTWKFVPPSIPNYCPNPNAGLLVRTDRNWLGSTNESTVDTFRWGVTQFSIAYYETFNTQIDTPYIFPGSFPPPVLMQVSLEVQPTEAYDTAYSTNFGFWTETRLVSRNLTAR